MCYRKSGGTVNYCTVYVDGTLVYNEHHTGINNYDFDTAVTVQNDGEEHIVRIVSMWGSTNVNRFVNAFKIYTS